MNVKRYKSFQEFHADFKNEFSQSKNGRLTAWFHQIGTLGQGCGCTRKARAKFCFKEYRKVTHVLKNDNINLMKMKFPNTQFEFAEGDELFWVMPTVGHQYSPLWPKDASGVHVKPE